MVYVTPHHQYPTTVTLSPSRRLALLDLAARHRIAVVEDDYDHEFHYDGRPLLPLASADPAGVVVYVGSLAKVLAPGLRLGFVVAPQALLKRMAAERALVDRQGDLVLERAVAELIEEGELQRHVRRLRRVYEARRDTLCEALERSLSDAVSFRRPRGGMALWLTAAPGIDVDAWHARALRAGLMFQTGRAFSHDGRPTPHLRLGFAIADERELRRAVEILARTRAANGVARRTTPPAVSLRLSRLGWQKMSDPILSISGVTKTYASGFQALKRVDLQIGKGEIFALLGPNGAGKTTLISVVCGIVTPTSGTIVAAGHDIVRDYRGARFRIGLVPQELTTDAFESVWATVTFSRGLVPAGRQPRAHREGAAGSVAVGQAKRQDHDLVRRDEAPRDDRQGLGPRAGDPLPGRADRRRGRRSAPRHVGDGPAAAGGRGDDHPDHALHRRGRGDGRPDRHHQQG